MISKKYFSISLVLPIIIFLSCGDPKSELEQHSFAGSTMGTTYSIKIVTDKAESNKFNSAGFKNDIDSLLKAINQQMSTYISNSEISLFNRYNKTDWFTISKEFSEVLQMSIYISNKSEGAFDITIGPLVNLWGFGPRNLVEEIPTQMEINKQLNLVGYDNIEVSKDSNAVRKKIQNIYCDLSAIAKGFAVDKVSEYLESRAVKNFMVEIGGEIKTKGNNSSSKDWQIGIATPDYSTGLQKIVSISNYSMATSGDYLNYFEKEGVRYSHTIDPRTGTPITHNLASVTIVHGSCMMADAMATAISVMGPEEGFDFALNEELPIFMIVREGEKFVEKMTPNFEQFLSQSNN